MLVIADILDIGMLRLIKWTQMKTKKKHWGHIPFLIAPNKWVSPCHNVHLLHIAKSGPLAYSRIRIQSPPSASAIRQMTLYLLIKVEHLAEEKSWVRARGKLYMIQILKCDKSLPFSFWTMTTTTQCRSEDKPLTPLSNWAPQTHFHHREQASGWVVEGFSEEMLWNKYSLKTHTRNDGDADDSWIRSLSLRYVCRLIIADTPHYLRCWLFNERSLRREEVSVVAILRSIWCHPRLESCYCLTK